MAHSNFVLLSGTVLFENRRFLAKNLFRLSKSDCKESIARAETESEAVSVNLGEI